MTKVSLGALVVPWTTQLGGQEGVASFPIRSLGREGTFPLQSCHLASNSRFDVEDEDDVEAGERRDGLEMKLQPMGQPPSWKLLPSRQHRAELGWIKGSGPHLLSHSLLLHFYEKIYPETTFCFVQKGSWD